MRSKVKMLLSLGAVSVAMLALAPAGAQAAATSYTCEFDGRTTNLDDIPAAPATGGTGNFDFSGTIRCATDTGVKIQSFTASGSYSNTICGTGSATGSATIDGHTIGFRIDFVAGAGAIRVTSGARAGAGAVDIRPTNTGGCVTAPAEDFDAVGAFDVLI